MNSSPVADFRSDTVTRPTASMRKAMADAVVGDDVLDGDPTVGLLEERAAHWLGKQRALFVPSGTMANQIAVGVWVQHGDEVILEQDAHILSYESGALGALHGVQSRTLVGQHGLIDAGDLARTIRPDFVHCPVSSLLCVEQTHMASGGSVVPLDGLRGLAELAHAAGLHVHMDGARLANAVVASGIPPEQWTAPMDSVSLCLSKGLGAPVGSVVAGDAEFIDKARRLRKRFGGWMRQSGVLAAPALIALEDGPAQLERDHKLARELAENLNRRECLVVDPASVATNLVLVGIEHGDYDAAWLAAELGKHGVLVAALTPEHLRFVTHRDVNGKHLEQLADALDQIFDR